MTSIPLHLNLLIIKYIAIWDAYVNMDIAEQKGQRAMDYDKRRAVLRRKLWRLILFTLDRVLGLLFFATLFILFLRYCC